MIDISKRKMNKTIKQSHIKWMENHIKIKCLLKMSLIFMDIAFDIKSYTLLLYSVLYFPSKYNNF